MKIAEPEANILYPYTTDERASEVPGTVSAARTSRGSGLFDGYGDNAAFVRKPVLKGRLSALEFGTMTVSFTVDRAVANGPTRRRHISRVQESTGYVSYIDDLPVVKPGGISPNTKMYDLWEGAVPACEHAYREAIRYGLEPEYARSMLPNCLAARLIVKANFREWRHIFTLRANKAAHPDMREVMVDLAELCFELCPAAFGN
jgi:thymidylate synthase (FAD)